MILQLFLIVRYWSRILTGGGRCGTREPRAGPLLPIWPRSKVHQRLFSPTDIAGRDTITPAAIKREQELANENKVSTGTTEKPPPPRQHEDNRYVALCGSLCHNRGDDRPIARQKNEKGKVIAAPALATNIANRASMVCGSRMSFSHLKILSDSKADAAVPPESRAALMVLDKKLQDKKINQQQFVVSSLSSSQL
jgi:hypothetical protein